MSEIQSFKDTNIVLFKREFLDGICIEQPKTYKSKLNLDDKEMHILWRALLYYWENKDFEDNHELRHQVNMLREKMSDFMTKEDSDEIGSSRY